MAISETLKNAVDNHDVTAVRSCFYTIVLSDPGFQTNRFDEALNFVRSSHMDGLMDAHDGEELLPEEEWNEEYFDLLVSKLQDNFSEERIEQVKKVAKAIKNRDSDGSSNKSRTVESSIQRNDDYVWLGILGVVVAAFFVLRRIFKGGKRRWH